MRDGLTIRCNWGRWFATKVAGNEVNNGEPNRDPFQDTPCAVACRSRSLLLHSEPHGKSWTWIKIHKTYLSRIRIRIGHCCVRHGSRKEEKKVMMRKWITRFFSFLPLLLKGVNISLSLSAHSSLFLLLLKHTFFPDSIMSRKRNIDSSKRHFPSKSSIKASKLAKLNPSFGKINHGHGIEPVDELCMLTTSSLSVFTDDETCPPQLKITCVSRIN